MFYFVCLCKCYNNVLQRYKNNGYCKWFVDKNGFLGLLITFKRLVVKNLEFCIWWCYLCKKNAGDVFGWFVGVCFWLCVVVFWSVFLLLI